MLVVKAFTQNYQPTFEIRHLLETFRLMVNTCIRLGLRNGKTSRNSLSKLCYHELSTFKLHTWYRLYATSIATSALKNYREAVRKGLKPKKPYVKKLFAVIGSEAFKMEGGKLRLPIGPREWFYIPLSNYVLRNVSDSALKLCSVALTEETLSITVSKNVEAIQPGSMVGIDLNEDSVVVASEDGETEFYGFSEIPKIVQNYREVLSHLERNDNRIRKEIASKYGSKKRNRIRQKLHLVSKAIVDKAVQKKQGIVLEKLTGIRNRHRRGNNEGRRFRHRMNSWPFHELQRQIIYKAAWNGIPTFLIEPRWTSRTCSICGAYNPKVRRWLVCHACGSIINRHENAARNILARGVRFAPSGPPVEAMVAETMMVIRKVDGGK